MEVIAFSPGTKSGMLDDDYTLYKNGEVLHEYDRHNSPGGFNLRETLTIGQLDESVKKRLLDAASDENKELVQTILGLD